MEIENVKFNGRTYDIEGGSADDLMRIAPTLESAPTLTTLTYQKDGATINFEIGDLVRVADSNSTTGYAFYRLHDINENGEAIWSKLATGAIDTSAIVTVQFTTNQSTTSDLVDKATVTIKYNDTEETKTYQGSPVTFSVLAGSIYSLTFGAVDGFKTPTSITNQTAVEHGRPTHIGQYLTEILSITSVSIDEGTLGTLEITVNGETKTWANTTLSWQIPFGDSDAIVCTYSGYTVTITKDPDTDVADSATKTATIALAIIKDGIFAITNTGVEVAYEDIDTSNVSKYVGVVVRNSEYDMAFFIDKRFVQGSSASATVYNYKAWATNNYNTDIAGITNIGGSDGSYSTYWSASQIQQAYTNFKNGETGVTNTDKICNETKYASDTAANNAAKFCRSIANPITGKYDGYLLSAAEYCEIHQNRDKVNNTLTKIGGVPFSVTTSGSSSYSLFWTSTERDSYSAWHWDWISSYPSSPYMYYNNKDNSDQNASARPGYPIN